MITRWDPIRELADLQKTVNSIFEETAASNASQNFVPPVDVYEDENSIVLTLEIPGVKADEFDIRLENNKLTVRGERKLDSEKKAENYLRVERRYGTFVRSFTLPNTIHNDKVEASYNDGVLEIVLAKRAEAQPKQIKVNVNSQPVVEGQSAKVAEAH
jgi:HSP20 family protein